MVGGSKHTILSGWGKRYTNDECVRKLVNCFWVVIQVLRGHWQDANQREGCWGLKQVFLWDKDEWRWWGGWSRPAWVGEEVSIIISVIRIFCCYKDEWRWIFMDIGNMPRWYTNSPTNQSRHEFNKRKGLYFNYIQMEVSCNTWWSWNGRRIAYQQFEMHEKK